MAGENLYQRLGALLASVPSPLGPQLSHDDRQWLAEVRAALKELGDHVLTATFEVKKTSLEHPHIPTREDAEQTILQCLFDAIAMANAGASLPSQGAFVLAGNRFDALAAVGKIFDEATQSVMLVDPYSDSTLLANFAVLAAEQIKIEILADDATVKPDLSPAVAAWKSQYPNDRPIEVRLAQPRELHDRLIIVDGSTAWTVGQSFKDLAVRSHTSMIRVDPETAALKIAAYKQIWANSKVV